MKKVLFLVTGGTLGMRSLGEGPLVPSQAVTELEDWIPEIKEFAKIDVEILCNLDSTMMTPEHWVQFAQAIHKVQITQSHDGIVILHGTDTMSFTASALSFLLPSLAFPVVLTGSQKPLSMTRSDARNNVLGALEACLLGPTEVCVFFNDKAFRGNRCIKSSIHDFTAFSSPNYPALGSVGIYWTWHPELYWPADKRPTISPTLDISLPHSPWVVPWVPGLAPDFLHDNIEKSWAVILEGYGTGNLPLTQKTCEVIDRYISRGGIVAMRSQVTVGGTLMHTYEPGQKLLDLGIIPAGDMTRAALVTKMMILKAQGQKGDAYRYALKRNMVGEVTERDE